MSRRMSVRNIMPSFRFEEQQISELAAKSRLHSTKKGYMLKSDPKLKKLTQRWCSIYHNFFFFFESESVPKPLGVIVLEGCTCKPVEQADQVAHEGAISISIHGGKTFYFIAQNERDKLEWIQALNNSSMGKQHQEMQELSDRCEEYQRIISTKNSEVSQLRDEVRQAQQNIDHLHLQYSRSTPHHHSLTLSTNSLSPGASPDSSLDHKATVLQRYVRSWYLRRRWRMIVEQYMNSPFSQQVKQRNQLIWKFVASEEDYVSQLTILNEEYKQHLDMAAASRKPLLSLQHFNILFRNSSELLLLHQLFLRGLHSCLEKWPVIVLKEVLKSFVPIFSIYHKFMCDQVYAGEVLLSLHSDPSFKEYLSVLENRPACNHLMLESLLEVPLRRLQTYVKDLEELRIKTPADHVDYKALITTIAQLESIIKMMAEEGGQSEEMREVLKVEAMLEGGCLELLDKDQALIKQSILQHCEERTSTTLFPMAKAKNPHRHVFLFTKHLIITHRVVRKPTDIYKIVKIMQLSRCHVSEYQHADYPELTYCGVKVECANEDGNQSDTVLLLAGSVNEKAEWMADIAQCVENEKQNKVLQSQSIGLPVELSSRFIRYSTLKTGKEQLVNSGKLSCLLERLVKISCFGHNFLNTFLLSFPFYTDANSVLDFLEKSLTEGIRLRERRRGSVTPQDAIRDARVIQPQALLRSPILSAKRRHYSSNFSSSNSMGGALNVPRRRAIRSVQGNMRKHYESFPNTTHNEAKALTFDTEESFAAIKISFEPTASTRRGSGSSGKSDTAPSVAGALFALKQWICKHFYHFKNDPTLSNKLEELLGRLQEEPLLTASEKSSVTELCHIYESQKNTVEELIPIMKLKLTKEIPHLPSKPFECLLLWSPRATAEQLCLIEGALFQRVTNGEILRYFSAKGTSKSMVAPNLAMIFEHFNRMSLFFMWSVPNQRYFVDRTNIIKFLIQVGWECYQLHNFSSVMQLTSALEHGSTSRFKHAWEEVPKQLKQQFRQLVQLSSTEGRFKELRAAMKKATPPSVPYLGILLSEISGVVESSPTYLDEDKLINFSKMRRCVRLITMAMQHQKEPYEFQFIPEISKVLLHHRIPGNEDDLYKKVDEMEKNGELNPVSSS